MEAVQISRRFFFKPFSFFFSIGLNFTSPPVVVVGGGGVDVASRGLRLLLGATTRGVAAGGECQCRESSPDVACMYVCLDTRVHVCTIQPATLSAAPLLDERGDKRRRCGMGSACQWKPQVTAERQLVTLCFVPAVAAAQWHLRRAKSASFSSALLFLFLAAARIICTPASVSAAQISPSCLR